MKQAYTSTAQTQNKNIKGSKVLNQANWICRFLTASFLMFGFCNELAAQTYNYGTGSIAANPTGFNTAGSFTGYTISGNDLSTTGSFTITLPANPGPNPTIYQFTNFTVNAGHTITFSGINAGPVVIRCTGTMTINGTINCAGGNGGNGATSNNSSFGLGGTGGGGGGRTGGTGFWTSNGGHGNPFGGGSAGTNGAGRGGASNTTVGGGGGGGSYGTAGTGGWLSTSTTQQTSTGLASSPGIVYGDPNLTTTMTQSGFTTNLLGGSGGGAGGGRSLGFTQWMGAGGGGGGGAIQITANTINIGSQATSITVAGGNGGNNSTALGAAGGAGGGGSGGTINLQYFNYTNANAANLRINGGIGGDNNFTSARGDGGNGGQGRLYLQQDVILCTPPSVSATAFSASSVTANSATLNWIRGNGNQVIVIVREGAAVSGGPMSTTSYTANASFGLGDALGGGRVVYVGSGTSVTVNNLPSVNTIYHVAIFEFFTSSGGCYQAIPNQLTGNFTTADGPMTYLPSAVSQSSTTGMPLGAASQQIVQLQVNTGPGTIDPLVVTSLTFNTNGSTLTSTIGNDLLAARILYNTTNSLSGAVQFGSDVTSFPGGTNPIVVSGSQILQPNGNNFFFVVYDVRLTATTGNVLDAEIPTLSYTNGVSTFNPVPVPTTAAGSRAITSLMSLSCAYNYSFQSGLSVFPVSGAGTVTVATGTGIDDNVYTNQPFDAGFQFEYLGTLYSSFNISSNGFIYFGNPTTPASTIQSIYAPISNNFDAAGVIAVLAADLQAHSASTETPGIFYRTTGTAPNRICTIEWRAFRPWNNTGGLCSGFGFPTDWNRLDFQIKLYENGGSNSNRIELCVRDMEGRCVNGNSLSAQVGLRGPNNTQFLNRLQASGNWTTTSGVTNTAGSANNAVAAGWGSSNYAFGNYASDFTFRYTPTFQIPTITPSPSAFNTCPTETVTLSTTSPVTSRQWYRNDLPITLANGATYNADQSGNHVLMVNQGGCAKLSSPTAVTITPCRSITTNDLASPSICAGAPVSVSYTVSGPFTAGNVFTAQLSDASGSFASPVTLGTLTGINGGTISAGPGLIPAGTPAGIGYRIRVVGSNPAIIGSETSAFEVLEPAPVLSVINPPAGCLPLSPVDITAAGVVSVTNAVVVNSTTYWTNASATVAFTGDPAAVTSAGTLFVKKENACGSDVEPVVVTFNNPIVSSHSSSNPTSCAGSNGSITLNGLLPSTSYQVLYQRNGPPNVNAGTISTNGSGALVIPNLQDGNYDNIVLSRSGCSAVSPYPASGQITLSDPAAPVISSVTPSNPTTCLSGNGSLTLNGLLASTAYTVSYDRNGTTVNAGTLTSSAGGSIVIGSLLDGAYDNIFVSRLGCNSAPVPAVGFIDLSPPGNVVIAAHVANNPTTCLGANGSIQFSGLSPSSSFTVTYTRNGNPVNAGSLSSNAGGILTVGGLNEASYSNFVLTSGAGCASPAYPALGNISLVDPIAPSITGVAGNNPITCGGADGNITLLGLDPSLSYTVSYRRNNGSTTNAGTLNSNGAGDLIIPALLQGDYDQIIVSRNNCSSSMIPSAGSISLFDPLPPPAPTGIPAEVCGADVLVLTASGAGIGEDYNWYDAPIGGNLIQNGGVAFGTPFLTSTTTYHVSMVNTISGCESPRVPLTATIFPLPAQPVITPSASTAICSGNTITLSSSYLAGNTWSTGSTANSISVSTTGSFTVTVTDLNGCSSTSAPLITNVISCATTWTGAVSTAWDNPSNWSTGVLPDASTNVTLQLPVTHMPRIQTGVNGLAQNLSIGAGVTLTIDANQVLFVSGNISASAPVTIAGDGIVRMNGTAVQTINGAISYPYLRIANISGVIIETGQQSIRAALELETGQLTTNNLLRLISVPNSTAYINDFSPGNTGTLFGNVTVQRYVAGGPGYRYLSSPMTLASGLNVTHFGPFVNGINNLVFDPDNPPSSAGFPTVWLYQENDANATESSDPQWGWVSATTAATPLEPLKGYAVNFNGNTTVSLTGLVNTGSVGPLTITNTPSGNPAGDGHQLVGNPYPSPISWNALRGLSSNSGQFTSVMKSWSNSGQYSGQYADFNGVVGNNGGNDRIAIGQAVMIRRGTPGAGALSIDNSVRVAELNPTFFEEPEVSNLIRLRLSGTSGADEMVVYFDPQASDGYDENYDAIKMLSSVPVVPNIYSEKGQDDFSINVMGAFNTRREVPVGIKITQAGTYHISAYDFASFNPSSLIFLEDKSTNTFYNLRIQPELNFELTTGVWNDRFVLHFELPVNETVISETCVQNDGAIQLNNTGNTPWNAELYNEAGVLLEQVQNLSGEHAFDQLPGGDYALRLIAPDGYTVENTYAIPHGMELNASFSSSAAQVFVGDVITLTPQEILNGVSYFWDFGDGITSTQTNPQYSYANPGIYSIRLLVTSSGCEREYQMEVVVRALEDPNAIGTTSQREFLLVYPNPANSIVTIDLSRFDESSNNVEWLEIFDGTGRLIRRELVKGMLIDGLLSLPVTDLSAGVYHFRLSGDQFQTTVILSVTR